MGILNIYLALRLNQLSGTENEFPIGNTLSSPVMCFFFPKRNCVFKNSPYFLVLKSLSEYELCSYSFVFENSPYCLVLKTGPYWGVLILIFSCYCLVFKYVSLQN